MLDEIIIVDNSKISYRNFRQQTFETISNNLNIKIKIYAPEEPKLHLIFFSLLRALSKGFFSHRKLFILFSISSILICPILKIFGHKVICFFPGLGRTYRPIKNNFLLNNLRKITLIISNMSDLNIFLSESDRKLLSSRNKFSIFPSEGINMKNYQLRFRKKITNVAFIGRPIEEKGILEYLEIVKKASMKTDELNFYLYGSGFENKKIKSEVLELSSKNDNFYYEGYQFNKKFFSKVDLIIFPSYYGEGFPITVLEGMASGCEIFIMDSHWTDELRNNSKLKIWKKEYFLEESLKYLSSNMSTNHSNLIHNRRIVQSKHDLNSIISKWEKIILSMN